MHNILEIAHQFKLPDKIINIQRYGNGNINETFLLSAGSGKKHFILQCINKRILRKPKFVMHNMRVVTEHIHKQLQFSGITTKQRWEVPRVIQTYENQDLWIAPDQTVWRTISFIENAKCFDTIESSEQGREIGCALGMFHNLISNLPTYKLMNTLEDFHVTPIYLNHYDQAIKMNKGHESYEVNYCIQAINKRKKWANVLEDAKVQGKLTPRPIHGDPKLDNILIDNVTEHAVGLIDLDTVKCGLIQYDIGDCIRSSCNRLGEGASEKWKLVYFDTDICRSILQGYISQAKNVLTENDYKFLYNSIRLMAFELGVRFFTDYLQRDIYFKIKYPKHNLLRSLVQFKLLESIESQKTTIQKIISDLK